MVEKGLDVGFAYDGDADRCLCVDEKGNVITGDPVSYTHLLSIRSCSCFLMRVVRVLVIMDTTSIAMPENRFSGRVKLKAK